MEKKTSLKSEEEIKAYVLDRYAALKGAIMDEEVNGRDVSGLDRQRLELFQFAIWYGIDKELCND